MIRAERQSLLSGQSAVSTPSRPVSQAVPPEQRNWIPIVQDRRRHQRVKVPLTGRFMRSDKQEFPCRITNISPGGIAVLAPVACETGERIVIYLDELGRLQGNVVRSFDGGFAIRLTGTAYKREKIANQLTWILNKSQLDMAEDRAHGRSTPGKQMVKIALADGSVHECQVLDVSLGGVSVSILPRPELGQPESVSGSPKSRIPR